MRNTQLVTTCGKLGFSNLLKSLKLFNSNTSQLSRTAFNYINSETFIQTSPSPASFILHLRTSATKRAGVLQITSSFAIQHPFLPRADQFCALDAMMVLSARGYVYAQIYMCRCLHSYKYYLYRYTCCDHASIAVP